MNSLLAVRILYVIAALYDGLLGLIFLVAAPAVYNWSGITPPNHWGYVHFSAGTLAIFGYMFLAIARRPIENRNLVPYGMLLKVCYVLTVTWHELHGGVPMMWIYFAVADTVFLALFCWSQGRLAAAAESKST